MAASQVFISYASTDAAIVRRLRERLEPHGVDLWIDRRELASGDALESEIRTAIDASLVSETKLFYMDAVEVLLLLERLG